MLVNCLIQIASILHKECIQFFITFQDDFSFFAFNKVEVKHKLNGKTLVLTFHGFLQSFKSRDNVRTQQKALLHPSTHLPCGWGKDTGSRVSKLQKKNLCVIKGAQGHLKCEMQFGSRDFAQ